MNLTTHQDPHLFINLVDHDTREHIIRLDQKLKGLRAEINAKLENTFLEPVDEEYKKQLDLVVNEVDTAITNIENLCKLKMPEEPVGKEMKAFSSALAKSLKKISKAKEKL